MAPLVELSGVSARAGAVPILEGIDLRLESGECAGVSGPNGSGKTTLLRVIATLRRPSAGTGIVLGVRLGTQVVYTIRSRVGLSGHSPAFWPELTLAENLRIVCRLAGLRPEEAGEALEQVGLAAAGTRLASRSSHGMLRRLDLARLLLTRPTLLLLDEPHAGLDADADPLVGALVRATLEDGGAAVLVSHDPAALLDLAQRHLALSAGRLQPLPVAR